MDTLTFNAPVLYRHLTFSEAKKAPISEIILEKALDGFGVLDLVKEAGDIRVDTAAASSGVAVPPAEPGSNATGATGV